MTLKSIRDAKRRDWFVAVDAFVVFPAFSLIRIGSLACIRRLDFANAGLCVNRHEKHAGGSHCIFVL